MRGKNKNIDAGCIVKLWVKTDTVAFEMLNAKIFNSDVDALTAKKKKRKKEAFSQTLKGKSINLMVIE